MPFDLANLVLFFMKKRRKRMAKTRKLIWSLHGFTPLGGEPSGI